MKLYFSSGATSLQIITISGKISIIYCFGNIILALYNFIKIAPLNIALVLDIVIENGYPIFNCIKKLWYCNRAFVSSFFALSAKKRT